MIHFFPVNDIAQAYFTFEIARPRPCLALKSKLSRFEQTAAVVGSAVVEALKRYRKADLLTLQGNRPITRS